jgi:hypothetical protein
MKTNRIYYIINGQLTDNCTTRSVSDAESTGPSLDGKRMWLNTHSLSLATLSAADVEHLAR